MTRIAFLGTGAMGARLAHNLLQAQPEITLIVYNRTVAKLAFLLDQGAVYAPTPKAAAEQADVIISMVTNDDSSRAVWLHPETGAVRALAPNQVAIAMSTLTVNWTMALAKQVEAQGADFLAVPVVGSRPQAEASTLTGLVGGKPETVAAITPILSAMGIATHHHVGTTGQAMAMKLAVNGLFGMQVAALAEVSERLVKQGLPLTEVMSLLQTLPILSPAAKLAGNLMVAGQHAPLFPIELVAKDIQYLLTTATAPETELPMTQAVQAVYQRAIAAGYGADNITGVVQLFP